MDDLIISHSLTIPGSEVRFAFSRSGGKGGQNVNKVETKVELLFDVTNSPNLSDEQRTKIVHYLRTHVDSNGILHVVSQASRSQWKNREEAVAKFVRLIQQALRPRKKRIKTKVPAAAKQYRMEAKKRRSEVKRLRRIFD